ncbi:MAG: GNAT family N-acetyltransferase [Aquabacterium sp.]
MTATASSALNVEVLRGPDAFDRVRPAWLDLLAQTRQASFVSLGAVAQGLCGALAHAGREPVVLRVARGPQVVALAVARLERRRLGPMPLDMLVLVSDPQVGFSDLLLAPGQDPDEVFGVLARSLPAQGLPWQALLAPAVLEGACVLRLAESLPGHARWRRPGGTLSGSSWLDCSSSYDTLAARFTPLLQRNLAKGWRRLERTGAWTVQSVAGDDAAADDALAQFTRLEDSGWKGAAGTGSAIALHPRLQRFFGDLYRDPQAPQARSEIHLLRLDGQAIAAQFCVRVGGSRHVLKIGYDAAHGRLNPGHLLLDAQLRQSCADPGIDRLGLAVAQDWHADWAVDSLQTHELVLFRQAWVARLWRFTQRLRGQPAGMPQVTGGPSRN